MKKLFSSILIAMTFAVPGFSGEDQTLDALITAARANNAEIIAARERWNAAKARAEQEKTWDNPRINLEYWSIPEGGFDISAAGEKMYGFSQMIPFPGKLSARGKAAGFEADGMQWEYTMTELDVLSRLRSSYAMYYSLSKSIDTYRETAAIMKNYSTTAESRYVAGKSSQSDVLRAQVEAEKMANMVITLEQERETVQTEINLLLGRSAGEKLGPPEELTPVFLTKSWDDVQTLTLQSSPEIRRSSAAVSRGKWSKRAAKMEYLPDFDISYRRKQMNDMWSGSDAMLGVSVPLWFWKQRAGVKQASAELTAAEAERKNTELMAVSRAKEVYTRLDATQRLIELYRASVIPKSEQSLTVAQSSFTGGKSSFLELLDSIRSYLELRLEYFNYIADYQKNRGALEKIVGTELWGDKS